MRYLRNELKKSISIIEILAMLVFLIVGNWFIYLLYENKETDWRVHAISEKEYYVEALKQIETQGEDELGITKICVEEIAIIDYALENDIPYKKLSVFENISKNNILTNFIVIMISLMAYNIICVEFNNDTWKNVVIFNSSNYKKIFLRKKMVSHIITIGMIGVFVAVAILFGAMVYRNWSNVILYYSNGIVNEGTYNNDIINMLTGVFIRGCVYSSLAFLFAALFKEKKGGIVVLVLIIIFENTIHELTNEMSISTYLPFRNINVLLNITDYKISEIIGAVSVIFVYVVLIEIGAYYALKKNYSIK